MRKPQPSRVKNVTPLQGQKDTPVCLPSILTPSKTKAQVPPPLILE